jgi:RNA polymerase sigma-70 factor, ECF subfamily
MAELSELISRCMAGDEAAFESLYTAHAGRIKAYFLRSGFSFADADDLTQEVFVRAFKSLHTFDATRGSFATWLGAIARNVARRGYSDQAEQVFDPELAEAVLSTWDDPGSSAETREALDALAQCIDALPPDLARIVHLRYVQGLTTRGIAATINMPEATVRLRLGRIAELLGQCLSAKGILEE